MLSSRVGGFNDVWISGSFSFVAAEREMRMRSRERGRAGVLDIPKKIIIKITSKSIPVR